MKKKKSYVLLLLIISVFAKGDNISVSSFPLMEGLPSNTIQRVFQDKEGFLWLGTLDGLCRYDAYRLLVFRSDVNNPDLLTNNEITCFEEDKDNILIGTKSGLNILNKKTYNISPFCDTIIRYVEIKSMKVTSDGNIWIGTTTDVYCYNPDYTLKKSYQGVLPTASVNSFYEDDDHNLWLMLWQKGLYKYNAANDSFTKMPRVGEHDNAFSMFVDSKNQYWICTWYDGVYVFNNDGDDITYRDINIMNKEKHQPENIFYSIVEDNSFGYIWIMSTSGIYAFEYGEKGSLQEVDISELFTNNNNIYSEIIKDNAGNLLIATFYEGLLSVNFDNPNIENHTFPLIKEQTGLAPNIASIYKDDDGDIWIYQDRWGLGLYRPDEDKIVFYRDIPVLKNQEGFDVISYISGFRSMPGVIWALCRDNKMIFSIKKENGKIVSYEPVYAESLIKPYGAPKFLFEDKNDNIWITTTSGLHVKTPENSYTKQIGYNFGDISRITQDNKGRLWISSSNAGVYIVPVHAFPDLPIDNTAIINLSKESGGLLSNNIEAIHADKQGNVWVSTNEGYVLRFDTQYKYTDMTASLNFYGEKVLSFLDDQFGHIWAMTDKRIIEYNPSTGASRDYAMTDGVCVSSFRAMAAFNDLKNGKLYFGGNKGISIFTPSGTLQKQDVGAKTLITDVKINNHSTFSMPDKNRFDITSQTLKLEPDDKNIEIDFSSLNYNFPTKIRFAYRMEGVDDKWVYSDNRQYAFYNKLSKGSRRLYVRATDENNIWNTVVSELHIYKHPAVYETWWAYIIYFMLFAVTVYMTVRITKNRIKLQNEIKIIQIEKNKSEELTQTKLRYFTNISHDFLTPLTILSCLVDDAESMYKNDTSVFNSMRSNINKLIRLFQQILDFRKIENNKMNLNLSKGDIVKFIKEICYTNFTPLIKKKKINFSFSTSSDFIQAVFDADKIDKIIYNLLSNAFKYTLDGGFIDVEVEEDVKNGCRWVSIKVKDSGVGIEPEHIPHVFTRFFSINKNVASETNGIGLSLAKELIDIHKGHISVYSKPGDGTVFTAEIPVDVNSYNEYETENIAIVKTKEIGVVSYEEYEKTHSAENHKDDDLIKEEPTTILIVEDNEELRNLIRNLLSHHYHVLTASDGLEAMAVLKDTNVDVIVSDVLMPNMDGLELCREIKKDIETSHISVILLTAKNSVDDRVECYNAGADGYLSKPFDLKVLNARIRNFITNKKNKQKEFQKEKSVDISKLEYQTLDKKFLNQAIEIIEENFYNVDFDVNNFASAINMSKSTLYRKLKTITGLSPVEFMRNIRLKSACQKLKDRSISVSEVAYSVGFSDPKYFAKCFKNEFNISPSDYQKKIQN